MIETITVQALKYPDIPHYEYEADILEITNDYVLLFCKSGRKLVHHTRNDIFTMKTASIEYLSLKEWYTVAVELEDEQIIAYYCNVAMPSVLKDYKISFVDLDLDLIKKNDNDWQVIDEDEFEDNSVKYAYPPELKKQAVEALKLLIEKAKQGHFPFNKDIMNMIK